MVNSTIVSAEHRVHFVAATVFEYLSILPICLKAVIGLVVQWGEKPGNSLSTWVQRNRACWFFLYNKLRFSPSANRSLFFPMDNGWILMIILSGSDEEIIRIQPDGDAYVGPEIQIRETTARPW